jgi:hypothetical protein
MNAPKDVLGRDLAIGQRVGVAFSYSQASVGHIRLGEIREMFEYTAPYGRPETVLRIWWEHENVLSPKIKYGAASRWIIL